MIRKDANELRNEIMKRTKTNQLLIREKEQLKLQAIKVQHAKSLAIHRKESAKISHVGSNSNSDSNEQFTEYLRMLLVSREQNKAKED